MVVAGDAAPDVAWLGGVAFGLDRQVADDADACAGGGVLKGDPGWPHGVDLADGWAVLPCNRAAGPAEEDVGDRGPAGRRRRFGRRRARPPRGCSAVPGRRSGGTLRP